MIRPRCAAAVPTRMTAARLEAGSVAATLATAGGEWPFELRSARVPLGAHWADACAALTLLPAMRAGEPVALPDGVSPRLLASLPAAQEVLLDFDRVWDTGLRPVAISGAARSASDDRAPGVACLFSGGVDSFYSLRRHRPEITHLLFVHGFDIALGDSELLGAASRTVNTVAERVGVEAIEVETDLRAVYDGLAIAWPQAHGAALVAVALLLQDTIGKLIVPSTFAYRGLEPWGSHPHLDPLWGTERLEVVHDGAEATRPEKLSALVADDLAMDHLRVCWENRGGAYNCGECEKCVRTMINLRIAGGLGRCRTLPATLDLDAVAAIPIYRRHFLVENIAAAAAMDPPDPELQAALVDALRRHDAERPPSLPTMSSGTAGGERHSATNVRARPGELSFDVSSGGVEQTVWLRSEAAELADVAPTADAALATCLMPAMRTGGTLSIDAPISPRLLRGQEEFQAIQRFWQRDWTWNLPPLEEVAVEAPARDLGPPRPTGRVAAFFSGGVDSWWTVLEHPELTHLVFVRGTDIRLDAPKLADEAERRLREAAAAIGLPLIVVETNLRDLSEQIVHWPVYFGCALAAVALFLAPAFDRILIAGDSDYPAMANEGAHPLVDHLWGAEGLELAHVGGRVNRIERTLRIVEEPAVRDTLRVCWENRGGAYNCGHCPKCMLTLVPLEAAGWRDRISTFPDAFDLDALAEVTPSRAIVLALWQDVLDFVRTCDRPDLEAAMAALVARGLTACDVPADYRYRDRSAFRPVQARSGAEAHELANRLDTVLASRSWRLTAPLRRLAGAARRER